MRLRKIEDRTDRNNSHRINFRVRHVVVTFDVIEIDRLSDAGLLIQIHQISLKIRIIENTAHAALKMNVINDIEPNERTEKSPVALDDAIVEQVATIR